VKPTLEGFESSEEIKIKVERSSLAGLLLLGFDSKPLRVCDPSSW